MHRTAVAEGPGPDGEFLTLRAAIHIHTTYSTGAESLRQVAVQARQRGLDVLVVTDDDLLEVTYGLPPLRRLLRGVKDFPSLATGHRLGAYLREIHQLDDEFDDLILIDGIESAPYYHWEADWSERVWTVRGWNKHIVAVGLEDAGAYEGLPILGGEAGLGPAGLEGVCMATWPLVGLLYALWLGREVHRPGVRALVGIACLLFLVDGVLGRFRSPRFSPYHDQGAAPYQAYIDAVVRAGGLVYWAHPEGGSTILPQSLLGGLVQVRSHTAAHARDLVETGAYTGFAALYADNITATEPGREWDRVLTEFLRGERTRPAWGTGEIDYHEDVEGNRIHDIQTVLWVRERTREAVLEALARGRCYAVRGGDRALILDRWSLRTDAATAVSGEQAEAGASAWRIRAVIDKVDGAEEEVRVRLVRGESDGTVRVVADATGLTPLRLERVEMGLRAGERRYYRLLARSRTSMLTSNPLFVRGG